MLLEARLRAFAAFARRRSFSAAAGELRISQPVVSKHIADLERALGLRLVERARRDGALTSAGEFVANHVLRAEFKHSHPGVRISLELGTAKQAVEWLRSHRAELGFIANAVGGPEIEAEPLLENEIAIVGRASLVSKRPSREILESLTWISREEGSATRSASERAMARLGIVPRQRLELPSYEAVLSALKRGYGVAAMSRYIVAAELQAGSLT